MTTQTPVLARPYRVTPISAPTMSTYQNSKGETVAMLKVRANVTLKGREVPRTITAKGKAVEAIGELTVGATKVLRLVADKFVGTDGKQAVSFAAVGIQKPRAPKAANDGEMPAAQAA